MSDDVYGFGLADELRIREATREDCIAVAESMRDEDRAETFAMGYTPKSAVLRSLLNSEWAMAMLINGEPMTVCGVVRWSLMTGTGIPWVASTPLGPRHPKLFVKLSMVMLEEMLRVSPELLAMIHTDYKRSLRWASWLGFRVASEPVPWGPRNELFHRAEISVQDARPGVVMLNKQTSTRGADTTPGDDARLRSEVN